MAILKSGRWNNWKILLNGWESVQADTNECASAASPTQVQMSIYQRQLKAL